MEREQLIHLVQWAQAGNANAMDTLFSAFYNDVYYFALKTVKNEDIACDITQESFVEVIRTIGNLREPAAFVTWLKQITYHQCTRYFNKKTDILVEEDEDGNSIFDTLADQSEGSIPAEVVEQEDFRRTIMEMVDALTEEQRSAVMLYYFDEMTVGQIAQIQNVSEGTVKSRLNYARKALKKSVEDYEKKHDIKLHSFAPLALFLLYFGKEAMPAAKAAAVRATVMATTGTMAGATAGAAVGSGVATAAAATTAKAVGVSLTTKIVAGVVAAALVVGGVTIALLPEKKDRNDYDDHEEEESVAAPEEEIVVQPEQTPSFNGDVLELQELSLDCQDVFKGYVGNKYELFYTDNGVAQYNHAEGGYTEFLFPEDFDPSYALHYLHYNDRDCPYYYDNSGLLHIFFEEQWISCPGAQGEPRAFSANFDFNYSHLYELLTIDAQGQIYRYCYDTAGLSSIDKLQVRDYGAEMDLTFETIPQAIGYDYELGSRIYAFVSNNTLYTIDSYERGFDSCHGGTNTGIYAEQVFADSPYVYKGQEDTMVYAIMSLQDTIEIPLPEGKTTDQIDRILSASNSMLFLFKDGTIYYMNVEGITYDGECIHSELVYAEALTQMYQEGKIKQFVSSDYFYAVLDDNLTYRITPAYLKSII